MTDARLSSRHKPLPAGPEAPPSSSGATSGDRISQLEKQLSDAFDKLALRDTRIADLVVALEREGNVCQELMQRRETYDEEVAQLTLRAHQAETELEAIRPERDRLIHERDALRAEVAALAGERDALLVEVAAVTSERDALHASHSWKITAPVRWVSLRLRGHRG
jgi:chromosome segregation ATPase